MTLNNFEVSLPDSVGPAGRHNLYNIKSDDQPEAKARQPVGIDLSLVCVTLTPLVHEHAKVETGAEDEHNALAPVHGGVGHKIDPD